MRCPYCDTELLQHSRECPSCQLSFPKVGKVAGTLPRLEPGIADNARLLRSPDIRKLKKHIGGIKRRFPQAVIQIVTIHCPAEHPFSMYAFWILNAGNFAGNQNRGANNHSVLILVDPTRREAAIAQGYGFENQMPDAAIHHLLELSGPSLREGKWRDGLLVLLGGLEMLFESIAEAPQAKAISEEY